MKKFLIKDLLAGAGECGYQEPGVAAAAVREGEDSGVCPVLQPPSHHLYLSSKPFFLNRKFFHCYINQPALQLYKQRVPNLHPAL